MQKLSFNSAWTCKIAATGFASARSSGTLVWSGTLPHDAMIARKRDPNSPGGTAYGFFTGGDYDYSKTFTVPIESRGKTFVVEFEGIFNRGKVFVNGCFAGSVLYGYTGVKLDITPFILFGTDNKIEVKVVASDIPCSRWYTGSGLYRPAWLYVGGSIRIAPEGIRVKVLTAKEEYSFIEVKVKLESDEKSCKQVLVNTVIKSADGSIAGKSITPYTFGGKSTCALQKILIKDAKLWDADNPNLYSCEVTLIADNEEIDSEKTNFGIRTIEVNPAEGFLVNGKPVLFRGGCIHHDNGVIGAATFARAEERRVEKLKEAGFNAIRISHNSASKALLEAADRVGMYVMEESFDIWTESKSRYDYALYFAENWEKDVEEICAKDYNHPSVVMYSIGNEIQDLHVTNGRVFSRDIANKFRDCDGTRPVTNAINPLMGLMTSSETMARILYDKGLISTGQLEALQTNGAGINDVMTAWFGNINTLADHSIVHELYEESFAGLDLVGINYSRDAYDAYPERFPNMVYFGSETFSPDIDLNWEKVKKYTACVGDFDWTAWDYLGEAGIGVCEYDKPSVFAKSFPTYIAYCGDLDITGFRRPESYRKEIVWGLRKEPYIAVQIPEHYGQKVACTPWSAVETVSSWTWKGFEGKNCIVEVYSDAPEVELFVNGTSKGVLPCGEKNRFTARFDLIYEPGTIEVVAKYSCGKTEKTYLKTAGDEIQICSKADRDRIKVGDIANVDVFLMDVEGIVNTSSDRKVTIEVEGVGIIQGFGSGNPNSEENFYDTQRTTFNGHALAVIRAKEAGEIRVRFSAKECKSSELVIIAE